MSRSNGDRAKRVKRIALLGATGATGRHVLEAARAHGVSVTAIVRDASKLRASGTSGAQMVIETSLEDTQALARAFAGVDAVVSTVGVARRTPREHPSRHIGSVLAAMREAGVSRYIGISGAGLTLHGERKPAFDRFVSWLVRHTAPEVFHDKLDEYRALEASDVEWTLARAPRLIDGPPTGRLAVDDHRPPAFTLTRGDMAEFLLSQIDDRSRLRAAPVLGSATK